MTLTMPKGFIPGSLGNCGVVALTAITGAPYVDVWNWFRNREKRGQAWDGETYTQNYAHCAKAFGRPIARVRRGLGMTVAAWSKSHAQKGRVYLVASSDHVGVLCDGIYLDNSCIGPLGDRPGVVICRVTDAWLVLRKGERK